MPYVWIDKIALVAAIYNNTDADDETALHIVNTVLYKQCGEHIAGCADDDSLRAVCEGVYSDRVDDNLELCAALRAVYALVGEDYQIKTIVHDAIKNHGLE